ncbi:acyltransferase [Flavobacterium ginsengiterrae]|uniref:Acyltransferase n=1 Tax=Flavobacterium ginsengiterrae TaxID=871695 RepID=A0ABP7H4A8_9FLAO
MKNILKKAYIKLGIMLGFIESRSKSDEKKVKYKIGNVNMHNSLVDDLIPQAVTIGENFISSANSMIIAHDASLYNHIKKHRVEKIVIGDNVFLGAGAIILPGVNVGDGAIIGAGSIVTKNIEANTVVAGNPAKYICTVDEYIKKCEKRDVLFDTPDSFQKYYLNTLSQAEVDEFQEKYLAQIKNSL